METPSLLYTNIREHDIGYLKQYTESYFKLVHMNSVRISGFEEVGEKQPRRFGNAANKFSSSLSRSRAAVLELALCNSWDYFVTLTLDADKHDRYDLNASYKKLSKWFNNYNSRNRLQIKYLLIPEPHKDAAWHFHGLLFGLPLEQLMPFSLQDNIPQRIKEMLLCGRQVYNWSAYARSFGYVIVEQILDPMRCAFYMTKYITKALGQSGIELNHHLYYCSKGLNRAEVLYRGEIKRPILNPDFENDYVHIKRFSSAEEALPYFCDLEV